MNHRVEFKYTRQGLSDQQARAMVLKNESTFRKIFPKRKINNLYLDSPNLDCYYAGSLGAMCRKKVRIRWYDQDTARPQLEIKEKKGRAGCKTVFSLPPLIPDIKKLIVSADLPQWIKKELLGWEVTLENQYDRDYYLDLTKKVRVTVDSNLNFRMSHQEKRLTVDDTLIELKADCSDESLAREVGSRFPLRIHRFSKYIVGVEALWF